MPIKIPNNLPATHILEGENIFVMDADRAYTQDIRPLKILILNLMPIKPVTETQLLRLLGNTPLQVEVDFIYTRTYTPTHTSRNFTGRLTTFATKITTASLSRVRRLNLSSLKTLLIGVNLSN